MNVVVGPRSERVSGVVRRMNPTFEDLTDRLARIEELQISRYWSSIATQLAGAVDAIQRAHAAHCRREDCPTCPAVRQALAVVDADRLVQGGCTCPPTGQLVLGAPGCGCPPRVGIPSGSFRGSER